MTLTDRADQLKKPATVLLCLLAASVSACQASAHDRSPPAQRPTHLFQHVERLPFRTANNFHVSGAEWGVDYLKLFIDGKLVRSFTQGDVGLDWIFNNPMELPRRQWLTIEKQITGSAPSSSSDQLRLEIHRADLPKTKAAKLYIDDIAIVAAD